MEDINKSIQNLNDIRSMMEKSTKFISLSGLSGVFAGIYALIGGGLAYIKIIDYKESGLYMTHHQNLVLQLSIIGMAVMVLAIATGVGLAMYRSKSTGSCVFSKPALRTVEALFVPVLVGGIVSVFLLNNGLFPLISCFMLMFYGVGLVAASHYTYTDIKWLGYCEIAIGVLNLFFIGYGLLFWMIGFGLFHMLYGGIMYFKYER